MASPKGFKPIEATEATPPKGFVSYVEENPSQDAEQASALATQAPQPTTNDLLQGSADVALTVGTAAFSEVAGGYAGLGQAAYSAGKNLVKEALDQLGAENISGMISSDEDPLQSATDRINAAREKFTFTPKSQEGETMLRMMGAPFEPLMDAAQKMGAAAAENPSFISPSEGEERIGVAGSPLAGTVVQAGTEFAPAALGIKKPIRSISSRRADIKAIEAKAKELGIDLDEVVEAQKEQVVAAAEQKIGNISSRGQLLPEVQEAVKLQRDIAKQTVSDLYEQARATKAGVPVEQAKTFLPIVNKALDGFDVEDMPIVKRRLAELVEINDQPGNAIVGLNKIDAFRKRLSKTRAAATDGSQNAALNIIKGQLDEFLEAQFNADMISGDPSAIAKWKNARGAHSSYMQTFNENKFIRQMATQEATPEEMRSWIVGASSTGAKKQASNVVGRLKAILGEDSPEFAALRQDMLLDIVEPLMRENPNFGQFAKNYERVVLQNKTLADQMFPDSTADMNDLYKFSKAIEKRDTSSISIDLSTASARILFGHAIAKAALKVSLAKQAMDMVRFAKGHTPRNQIIGEILGYDPTVPIVPITATGIALGQQSVTGGNEMVDEVKQQAIQSFMGGQQ